MDIPPKISSHSLYKWEKPYQHFHSKKKFTMQLQYLVVFSLLLAASDAIVPEFCVGDISGTPHASGYPCVGIKSVTNDDFAYSGLAKPGNTSNKNHAAATPAFDHQFPALNGLGLSFARLDLAPGGVIPLHTHPAGSEILVVIEGTILAGFISSAADTPYLIKTLEKGDVMVFPVGLLHFQFNIGEGPALAFVSFSNQNPGLQIIDFAPFDNDLPTEIIKQTSFLDVEQIRKLKALFGGTNYGSISDI